MKGVILVENSFVHPYMPNSVPENKKAMLDELYQQRRRYLQKYNSR